PAPLHATAIAVARTSRTRERTFTTRDDSSHRNAHATPSMRAGRRAKARPVSGLALVVNRSARRFARDLALADAVHAAAGPDAVVIETQELPELDAAARQIRYAAPDTVAFCGGDGTYMAGLTALARVYGATPLPRIALVPGGTVSTVARNF